jgi:hypothetical protein
MRVFLCGAGAFAIVVMLIRRTRSGRLATDELVEVVDSLIVD